MDPEGKSKMMFPQVESQPRPQSTLVGVFSCVGRSSSTLKDAILHLSAQREVITEDLEKRHLFGSGAVMEQPISFFLRGGQF